MMASNRDRNAAMELTSMDAREYYMVKRPEVLSWFTGSGPGKWVLLFF